jgi:hypothetical protein
MDVKKTDKCVINNRPDVGRVGSCRLAMFQRLSASQINHEKIENKRWMRVRL